MKSASETSVKNKGSVRFLAKAVLLALAAGIVYFMVTRTGPGISDSKTFVLRPGTLPITVTASGGVKSLAPRHIRAEVRERDVKILSIVEEGRRITKEDIDNRLVLVELDSSGMEDNIMRDELDFEEARAEHSKSQQDIVILRKENESDIEAAERAVKFKAMDFKKYVGEALAGEVMGILERQREALATLEALHLAAHAYQRAESEATDLLQLAVDARAEKRGERSAVPEPREILGQNGQQNTGRSLSSPSASRNADSALAIIASSAGALLGDNSAIGGRGAAVGLTSFGFEEDTRSAEELEAAATERRKEADEAAALVEDGEKEFMKAAQAAGLNPSDFTGDPRAWSATFTPIDFAALGKDPRLGGEAAQERERMRTDIMLDQEELLMAKKSLDGSEDLFEHDFITETELEKERLAYERKSRMLELQREEEGLFFSYDFPKLAEQAYADYEEACRVLDRVRMTTFTKMTAAEVDVASARKRLAYHEQEISENEEQIQKYKIYAETEGLVVYGSPGSGGRYFDTDMIREGAEVREGMTLITIPDITQMAVEVNIHEAAIKKVSTGLKARIFVEAFPEEDVTGEVAKVAVLPSSASRYMNPDLKLYQTTVDVDGIHEWLKPGMTAEVEIYIDQLEGVLFVPLQAVTTYGHERVCYLANGERRVVETGQSNENYIEIKQGLSSGDEVLLDLRPFKGEVEEGVLETGVEQFSPPVSDGAEAVTESEP